MVKNGMYCFWVKGWCRSFYAGRPSRSCRSWRASTCRTRTSFDATPSRRRWSSFASTGGRGAGPNDETSGIDLRPSAKSSGWWRRICRCFCFRNSASSKARGSSRAEKMDPFKVQETHGIEWFVLSHDVRANLCLSDVPITGCIWILLDPNLFVHSANNMTWVN